jgi:hypothetical protein
MKKFDFIIIGSGQRIPLFSLSKRDSTIEKSLLVELALIMVALLQSLCS